MSKRKNISRNVSGFATNPVDRAMYDGVDTEETDALFSALSEIERGGNAPTAINSDADAMVLGGWKMTPTGLVPPANVREGDYREFGERLMLLDNSMQWLLGDYVNIGDNFQWGKTYQLIAEKTGKDVKTLRNYASVARSVEMSRRRDVLSFGHHEAVAKMNPEEQRYWLAHAENEGLSIAKLRAAIKEAQLPPPPPPDGLQLGSIVEDTRLKRRGKIIGFSNQFAHVEEETTGNEMRLLREHLRLVPAEPDDKQPHEYSPMQRDLTEGLQRGAAVNVPNAGAGTVVEVRGNFAFVDLDDGGRAIADLDDLTPTPPPPPPPPPTVENASTVQAQSKSSTAFNHEAFQERADAWRGARSAFEEVRALDMSWRSTAATGLPPSRIKQARQHIQNLIAHLHYIESTLGD